MKSKNHYTDELELKTLLIRIKNQKLHEDGKLFNDISPKEKIKRNKIVNRDVERFIYIKSNIDEIVSKSTSVNAKVRLRDVQAKLKLRAIKKSESTICDKSSYERFGAIIILMIKNILRKPNFSKEYYLDDFYSDAYYKILKYLHNFDHKKISKISGYEVNAFAYISQIIHNSIIHVIKKRKIEEEKIRSNFAENPDSEIYYDSTNYIDYDLFYRLDKICPLKKPYNLEDAYPFLIKDLLQYIEANVDCRDSIIDVISEYAYVSGFGSELVGDAINDDPYLMKFITSVKNAKYDVLAW